MTLKHWALVSGAVACLSSVGVAHVHASPWIEPGDAYGRFRVQQAVDMGLLDATVTAWPLARSNVRNTRQHDSVMARELWEVLGGDTGGAASLTVSGATDPDFIRDFGGSTRTSGELGLTMEYIGDAWAAALSPSYIPDPTDNEEIALDGSYLATTFSNWTAGAGYIDRWWGPGWQSSLILSDNARPAPSVWLNRRNTDTSSSPWLSWLGPWQASGFVARLENDRYVSEANLVGMRLNFRPVEGLEVGLSRLIQWGGYGQPESLSSFWDAFTGNDNYGSDGEEADPGNQLGGVDLRYGFSVNGHTLGLYTQVVGEDEAGYLPSRKVYLFGVDWTSSLLGAHQQWYLEGVDTISDDLFGGDGRANYAYEHFNYRSGMRYLGKNIANTFDGDARAVTLGAYHFPSSRVQWHAALTWADLNRNGGNRFNKGGGDDIDYFVPAFNQEVVMLQVSHTRPLPIGEITFQAALLSDDIVLADDRVSELSGAVSWTLPL